MRLFFAVESFRYFFHSSPTFEKWNGEGEIIQMRALPTRQSSERSICFVSGAQSATSTKRPTCGRLRDARTEVVEYTTIVYTLFVCASEFLQSHTHTHTYTKKASRLSKGSAQSSLSARPVSISRTSLARKSRERRS